ncbi:MAG: hypothetical protein ABL864_04070 [Terricaulis sp.]
MSEGQSASDAYNKVVERASLENIVLTSSSFNVSHEFHAEEENADRFIDQMASRPHFDEHSKLLMGEVRCRVWMNKATDSVRDGEKTPGQVFGDSIFSIEAKYGVVFKMPGEHNRDTLDTFFERMAPFSTWPYFRGHVAQVAAESGIDFPILPIKKLFHPVKSAGGYVDPDEQAQSPIEPLRSREE